MTAEERASEQRIVAGVEKAAVAARIVEVRRVRVWYVVLMGFLGMAIGLALAFAWIAQASKDSQRATCAVVVANRAVYRETPPTTETGRNAEQAWEELARSLGCNSRD